MGLSICWVHPWYVVAGLLFKTRRDGERPRPTQGGSGPPFGRGPGGTKIGIKIILSPGHWQDPKGLGYPRRDPPTLPYPLRGVPDRKKSLVSPEKLTVTKDGDDCWG